MGTTNKDLKDLLELHMMDLEVLVPSKVDKGDNQEYVAVGKATLKKCFEYKTFNGTKLMELGIGTSDKKRKEAKVYIVIEG